MNAIGKGGLVVVCGTSGWEGSWMAERHLAEQLTRHGHVLYAEPLVSPRRVGRRVLALPRLQPERDQYHRLSSLALPAKDRALVHRPATALSRRFLRLRSARLGGSVQALINAAPHRAMLGACDEAISVYWVMDDYRAASQLIRLSTRRIERGLDHQLRTADLVLASSPALAEEISAQRSDVILLPNGCDVERLGLAASAPWPDEVALPQPIAGFLGGLSERIDWGILEAVADRGTSLLLVGPRQQTLDASRTEGLLARPNVQWVPGVPFERVPSILRAMDVGLVPYRDDPFNRASFPLKTLEYLAAGLPVISTELPASRWLASSSVTIVDSVDEFVEATDMALTGHAPGHPEERRALAARHSWADRAAQVAELIGLPGRPEVHGAQSPRLGRGG